MRRGTNPHIPSHAGAQASFQPAEILPDKKIPLPRPLQPTMVWVRSHVHHHRKQLVGGVWAAGGQGKVAGGSAVGGQGTEGGWQCGAGFQPQACQTQNQGTQQWKQPAHVGAGPACPGDVRDAPAPQRNLDAPQRVRAPHAACPPAHPRRGSRLWC